MKEGSERDLKLSARTLIFFLIPKIDYKMQNFKFNLSGNYYTIEREKI